jgi:hypothetical protein
VSRRLAIAGAALAALAAPTAARAEPDWNLQLEGGSEYDSNIHRVEVRDGEEADVDAAPLARLGARYQLLWRRVKSERLTLAGYGGLKLFATEDGQGENVGIVSADGSYEWTVRGRGAVLGLHGGYYDAIPVELADTSSIDRGRNFRTASAEASTTLIAEGTHRVSARAGYRTFEYKPDPLFDWAGDHYAVFYSTTWWHGDPDQDPDATSLDLNAGYQIERRGYDASARTSSCADEDAADPLCSAGTRLTRADLNHSLAAELAYTGERIYFARYELQVNDSNSHGESLVRQRFRLGLTTELWRRLYLTAEATVLVNIYLDPLLLPRDEQATTFVSIEDENRNALSLHLSRPLGAHWAAEARYAIYSNEFTNAELSFRRQTGYLGVVYRYGQ